MEEIKNTAIESSQEQEETSTFNFQAIYKALVLNWYWFILSLIICLSGAYIYLRYATPLYQSTAKLLIKDDDSKKNAANSLANASATSLGLISSSNGIDNEIEILQSHSLSEQAIRDLKLYVTYKHKGRVKNTFFYKDQPITVDVDTRHLEKLNDPILLEITREGNSYKIKGEYFVPINELRSDGPYTLERTINLPGKIATRAGIISFDENNDAQAKRLEDGESMLVQIQSPRMASYKYVSETDVTQTSKTTTIAEFKIVDEIPERSTDYLRQLIVDYNRQANDDKNIIALRTEKFINQRLEKINSELGQTEGQLESYKQKNGMVELKLNATKSLENQSTYDKELNDIETQIELLNSIRDFMNERGNKNQVIPSNVGLNDQSSTTLINKYNELVLERNRLLRSAAPNSPVVEPITDQINDMNRNIRLAIQQALHSLQIQRNALEIQNNKYNNEIAETPQQERMLTQIGRQQEVKSGLYLMLLQKREENSIQLAATADKGKIIDEPMYEKKVSPRTMIIALIAFLLGIGIPSVILYLINFFRYKIEGHEDVARLTKLPIIADVAVAGDGSKTRGDVVVHENENNQMTEIFRSMRTNLQFMLKDDQKTILFTSSTSGEGKTFTCANVAMSFALLGKKVIIVGLDVRKPRLAELFEINDHVHGITQLLVKDNPTREDIQEQIIQSEINGNLDLLMAGPVPPNPAELLARNSLDIIFEQLKDDYDYILIDSAPVGLVTDTLQIGRVANVTVFMCRADYTPKASFDNINALSEQNKLPNICIVINGIDMSKRKNSYYYGYGSYGKYGRYGNYGHYGRYGSYGSYGGYGGYGSYGNYSKSHYGKKNDHSIKR